MSEAIYLTPVIAAVDQFMIIAVVGAIIGLWILLGMFRWMLRFYVKVDQGHALIINPMSGPPKVTFTGGLVLPIVNRSELMDISVKTIEIDRKGSEGLICQDNIRADIKVTFFVRINNTANDVLQVAQAIGCTRASEESTIQELFQAKFSEALKTAGRKMDFVELYQERMKFKEAIKAVIGDDLNGYKLEDVAIDYLEQTPVTALSPDNILDSQGIKKITELTAQEKIKANEIRRQQEMTITQQDVHARETVLEQMRRQSEAELKQKREIEVIKAREEAEAAKIASEERLRAEQARIKTDEEVAIAQENANRQIQVAQKNRERVIAIENERVSRDQQLEALSRERAVELQRIEKEKALEVERKNIQDVIRERVAVEKSVAEEEERIKDTRAFMTAERSKKVAVLEAEQHAQEALVKDIKHAEAQEIAAKHQAAQMLTMASAELNKSQKIAEAKMKMAEGIRAEAAAEGLAKAEVRQADAVAIEKVGIAEAKALREKVEAEAHGVLQKGVAEGKAKEAAATATEKYGLAEAMALKEKMLAEAAGITEKAAAMKALDESSREHEEFRLKLEMQKAVELAQIDARRQVATSQAQAMAEALKNAKMEIIGGDGQFFDKMITAIGTGKSLDALVDKSHVAQTIGSDYLNGNASLREDLKDILINSNIGTEDLKNLSVANLLKKLASSDEGTQQKFQRFLAKIQATEGGVIKR
ncbi:MAG TPA: hypothetical protein VEK08_25175 [Planctomycetota bacterium]|nr:hypothetical protein [Planctomycetota bacterium]